MRRNKHCLPEVLLNFGQTVQQAAEAVGRVHVLFAVGADEEVLAVLQTEPLQYVRVEDVGAFTRDAKAAAPALWSRWEWLTSTARTRSPGASAASSARRCAGSAGPGSITATSPLPRM